MDPAECQHETLLGSLCADCHTDVSQLKAESVRLSEEKNAISRDIEAMWALLDNPKAQRDHAKARVRLRTLEEQLAALGDKQAGAAEKEVMVPLVGWGQTEALVRQSRAAAADQSAKHDEKRLVAQRKLALIVDLDKTVLHTTNDPYAQLVAKAEVDVLEYTLHGSTMRHWTRLRPGVDEFLKAMLPLYEMQVYTLGTRAYAEAILRVLDPERKYFGNRILTMDESFTRHSKTGNLDALFPNGRELVAIIDDNAGVWANSPNLVHMVPYTFFAGADEVNAVPGQVREEAKAAFAKQCAAAVKLRRNLPSGPTVAAALSRPLPDGMSEAEAAALGAALATRLGRSCERGDFGGSASAVAADLLACAAGCGLALDEAAVCGWVELAAAAAAAVDAAPPPPTKLEEQIEAAVLYCDAFDALCGGLHFESAEAGAGRQGVAVLPATPPTGTAAARAELLAEGVDALRGWAEPRAELAWDLGGATAQVIAAKSVAKAVPALYELLRCAQCRTAVLLLRALRVLSPDSDWNGPDAEVLRHFGSRLVEAGPAALSPLLDRPRPLDNDTTLKKIAAVLHDLHAETYAGSVAAPSVPSAMPAVRARHADYTPWALSGVRLAFTGVYQRGTAPHRCAEWRQATALGAECVAELGPGLTHLVARAPGSDKFKAAQHMPGVHVLPLAWLEQCVAEQRHVPEAPLAYPKLEPLLSPAEPEPEPQPVDLNLSRLATLEAEMGGSSDSSDEAEADTEGPERGTKRPRLGEDEEEADEADERLALDDFANVSEEDESGSDGCEGGY